MNGQAPTYLRDLTSFREDRSHLSKNVKLLKVPKTTVGDRSDALPDMHNVYELSPISFDGH